MVQGCVVFRIQNFAPRLLYQKLKKSVRHAEEAISRITPCKLSCLTAAQFLCLVNPSGGTQNRGSPPAASRSNLNPSLSLLFGQGYSGLYRWS